MFTILGCWPLSGKAIDAVGPVFAAIMGVWIMIYGFGGFGASVLGGIIRVLGGATLIVFGLIGYTMRSTEESH